MKEHWLATKAIVERYVSVWKSAWSVRSLLDPPPRTADELAFLPAHLELTDTPVSPLPKLAIRMILALVAVALLWSIFGKLDIVAVAGGKTVPGGRTKVIQPLEAAVVKAIHVTDGQHVEAGQLLIELDGTGSGADMRKASGALHGAQSAKARYTALVDALDKGRAPLRFDVPGATADEIETENRLAASEYRSFASKRDELGSQLQQRQAELATTRELIVHLQQSVEIAQARSKDMESLVAKKYVARHDFLAVQQARVEAERDLATQQSRIFELQAAIAAQRDQRESMIAEFRRQTTDGLRQASEQAGQFVEDADKTSRRDQLMRLVAPVSGTVQQLAIHTVGGVVTPAQPLMAIVPEDDGLEIEAMVENKDIGFVREGQEVTIKVESFPYTRYGYLTGKVVSVSHDAIQDEKRGLLYQAKVRMTSRRMMVDAKWVYLSAGMSVTAEIKTGKRTVIDYVASPLVESAQESLRER